MRKFSCVNNKRAFAIFLFCTSLAIISQAQTLTTLANFNGTKGAAPSALVQGTDGNFYGPPRAVRPAAMARCSKLPQEGR